MGNENIWISLDMELLLFTNLDPVACTSKGLLL